MTIMANAPLDYQIRSAIDASVNVRYWLDNSSFNSFPQIKAELNGVDMFASD
jgi:hypothetical protein